MKRQWSMVGAIVLFLIVAILSVLNVDPVPINFGFATVELPLIIVIFASLLLGAIIATLLSTLRFYKEQRKTKETRAQQKTTGNTPDKRSENSTDKKESRENKQRREN